eukprot:11535788-Alexandrium_andersonii.AAC.1
MEKASRARTQVFGAPHCIYLRRIALLLAHVSDCPRQRTEGSMARRRCPSGTYGRDANDHDIDEDYG